MRCAAVALVLLSSAAFAEPAPRIAIAAPKLTGAIDAKLVGTTLRTAQTKLGDCYTKARAKAPELRGAATVTFTIAASGTAVAATATGLDQTAEACIAGVVGKLVFGKPKDGKGVDVSVVIVFEPGIPSDEEAELSGGFGFGRSGFGPGGGCGNLGSIGTGRYGTIGHGSGTGCGYSGGGCGGMRGRTRAVPTISIGQPAVTGDLDKAIVRRYIKRNIQKLSYCYEKQLLAKPTLAGTVKAEFTIAGTGLVSASTAKGVDKNVETCFAGVIKGIEFPKPKNGKDVKVAYPFTVRPAGG
jgi:hypothetical protein